MEPADLSLSGPSALRSRDRWLALQRLRAAVGADAVLLVLGPDAQWSRGGEVAFNWLLGGLGGRDLLAAPLDQKYEECIVCVRASSSKVFCKRALRDEVVAKTAMWESCQVIVPTAEEEADQDAYDSRKTWAFINMVVGCGSLAVPVRSDDEQGDLKMAVEKWPLVQAHAYDEFGLGFLTLRSSLVNIEAHLQLQLYPCWDLQMVLQAQSLLPQLRRAWDEAMLLRDRRPLTGAVDGSTLAAPLVDYFEYGRLSLSDEDICELRGQPLPAEGAGALLLDPAPRVLLGAVPSASICQAVRAEALGSVLEQQLQGATSSPLHMVWEVVEPLTGIAAARTYFFGAASLLHGAGSVPTEPIQALLRAYAAAAACCRYLLALPLAACAFSPQRGAELQQAAAAFFGSGAVPGRLEVACLPMDSMGMLQNASAIDNGVALLYVRVAVVDLTCPGVEGTLGTVAFGDTVFCVRPSEQSTALGRACSVLTSEIPDFACWPMKEESARSDEVKCGLESCLGIGFDPGPSVALGHRSGVRVYLEKKGPPPDPLELGASIDVGVQSALALDLSPQLSGAHAPIAGHVQGAAWTFQSGKIVIATARSGHVLLRVKHGRSGQSSAAAANGLVWIPVDVPCSEGVLAPIRAAVAVPPSTAAQFRALFPITEAEGKEEGVVVADEVDEMSWIKSLGASDPALDHRFFATLALAEAHAGRMPLDDCDAILQEIAEMTEAVAATPCRCVWVSGLPGCGAMDVAAALSVALSAPLLDLAALTALGVARQGGGPDDLATAGAALAQALNSMVAQGVTLVVVCDIMLDPADVLTGLAAQSGLAELCQVTHIISVLDPLVAYPWNGVRHPLVLSRVHRGWVSAVTLQDRRPTTATRSREAARERDTLSKLLLKELEACRSSKETVFQRATTSSLVSGPLQLPKSGRLPKVVALPAAVSEQDFLRPGTSLRCIFVPTAVPLDVASLRRSCEECLRLAAAGSAGRVGPASVAEEVGPWQGLFCVEAQVQGVSAVDWQDFSPEEMVAALHGGEAFGVHRMVFAPGGELSLPQHSTAPLAAATSFGVIFWWVAPHGEDDVPRRAAAEAAVEACRLRPPAMRSFWTVADLSPEEVSGVELALQMVELPPGFYFNGTCYVDVDGNERREHPALGTRLEEIIAGYNVAVEAWNRAAQEVAALPMFQTPSVRG